MKIPQVINRFNMYKNGSKLVGVSGEGVPSGNHPSDGYH